MMPLLNRLLRYGVVGGTAAAVLIGVLLLGRWMSLSLAINARSALFETVGLPAQS